MTGLQPFGFKEAIKKAQNFTRNMENGIETALDAVAAVGVLEISALAPRSGLSRGPVAYHNSIKVIEAESHVRIIASDAFVTSRSTGITYNLGDILEHGSHAHVIEPVLASVLFFDGIFSMHVDHPGTPPQPHFAPAIPLIREKFPNIFNTILVELWK